MIDRGLWRLLAAYVLAFLGIVSLGLVALGLVRSFIPEGSDAEVLQGLPALLAGGLASATALLLTLVAVTRPLSAERLRLRPGRETGLALTAVILGTLALAQTLDSALVLLGLDSRGSMALIRHALEGAAGPSLFLAVLVIGVAAGGAEEIFFRGYLQTGLRQYVRPGWAVVATSLGFAVFHLDWLHAALAFVLGLWLGFVTERTGSALPAVAAHVVNNSLFTLLAATELHPEGAGPQAVLGAGSAALFAGCAVLVARLSR